MLKKIAIVSVIFASACIGDGVGGDPGALYTDKGLSPSEQGLQAREAPPDMDKAPQCADLPQDDSACAHACDQDALLSYIPEGTCATFNCPLADGSMYVTGGCNN
jgi:hypothetical protein